MLDAGIGAHLLNLRGVSLDPALDVGNILERPAEHRFLVRAMRAPVSAIHLDIVLLQAARKVVVLVHASVISDVVRSTQPSGNDNADDHFAEKCRVLRRLLFFRYLSSFPSLLGHKSFYTTTRRAEGSTSSVSSCKVRASPSTITSTGPSSS